MKSQLQSYQQRINQHLEVFLNNTPNPSEQLKSAIKYASLNQGKRLRPALIYAITEALNLPLKPVDDLAAAIELIHSYSLVHDDLPAMDDDDLRRGQPTCHIQYDEATAILVGDAQLTYGFEIIANTQHLNATQKIQAIQILSQTAGANGMIGGQMIDIQSEDNHPTLDALKQMHLLKTGALIKAACLLGALPHPNFEQIKPGLVNLSQKIGLAFQVQDDILDIESSSEILGKPQGSDEAANKATYPKLMGLNPAKLYRDELLASARLSLKELKLETPFLTQLLDYIGQRNY